MGLKDFLFFVAVKGARTCGTDADEGALRAVKAAELGVEVVELLDDAASGADQVPRDVVPHEGIAAAAGAAA